MITIEQRIQHYKNRISSIWNLRNGKSENEKEIRPAIEFSIRRIREYKERIGE